jgi:hypothetical protein
MQSANRFERLRQLAGPALGLVLVLAAACHDVDEVREVDSDIDEDAGPDTDTDSDSDTDTGPEPTGIEPGVPYQLDEATRALSAVLSDSHLAVSYEQTDGLTPKLKFAALPWDQPGEVVTNLLPSPCGPAGYGQTNPFVIDDYFTVFVRPHGPDQSCYATSVVMNEEAEAVAGPYEYDSLFAEGISWTHWRYPDGQLGADGELISASMWSLDDSDGPYDNDVVFTVSRYGPGPEQEILADEVWDWPEEFGPNDDISLHHCRRHNFVHEGQIAEVALDERWNGVSTLLLASATLEGEVTMAPTPILELPGNPVDATHHNPAFIRRDDQIAGVLLHWNVEGDDSFTAGHSFVVSMDGEVLAGPTELPSLAFDKEFFSLVQVTGLDWSGAAFGYCYRVWNGPYEFIVLDEWLNPLLEPVRPLGDLALPNHNTYCDVVAVAPDMFAAFLSVEEGNADFAPGLYLVYIQVSYDE